MATHLIVYGHGAGDPGAIGNGTNECDFNRKTFHPYLKKWADKLKNNKIVFWDTTGNKDLFQETAKGWGIYGMTSSQYASITEYHLDAASATATGGHGIIYKTYDPDTNDKNVVLPIRDFVGWWGSVQNTNGINRRDNLLNCNVAAQRGISYRLVELGFITNSSDMAKLKANLDQIAKRMIEALTGEKIGDTVVNDNGKVISDGPFMNHMNNLEPAKKDKNMYSVIIQNVPTETMAKGMVNLIQDSIWDDYTRGNVFVVEHSNRLKIKVVGLTKAESKAWRSEVLRLTRGQIPSYADSNLKTINQNANYDWLEIENLPKDLALANRLRKNLREKFARGFLKNRVSYQKQSNGTYSVKVINVENQARAITLADRVRKWYPGKNNRYDDAIVVSQY